MFVYKNSLKRVRAHYILDYILLKDKFPNSQVPKTEFVVYTTKALVILKVILLNRNSTKGHFSLRDSNAAWAASRKEKCIRDHRIGAIKTAILKD